MLNSISGVQYDIDEVIRDIDKYLFTHHKSHLFCKQAILEYELPVELRNEVAKRYLELGWKYVYHTTSSDQVKDVHREYTLFELTDVMFAPDDGSFLVVKSEINPNEVVVYKANALLYTIH